MPSGPTLQDAAQQNATGVVVHLRMASQLAAAREASPVTAPRAGRVVEFVVRRRVPISIVLFTSLILLDLLVIRCRPRDVLNLADPLVVPSELLILAGLAIRS